MWLLGNTFLRQVLDGEYPKLVRLYSELWRRVHSLGGPAATANVPVDQTNVTTTTELDGTSMTSLLTVDNSSASLSLDDNNYESVSQSVLPALCSTCRCQYISDVWHQTMLTCVRLNCDLLVGDASMCRLSLSLSLCDCE